MGISKGTQPVALTAYCGEEDIGIIPYSASDATLDANKTKMNLMFHEMWNGGSFPFRHRKAGPILHNVVFPGKTYFIRPGVRTSRRIGSSMSGGMKGMSYIMPESFFTEDPLNNQGGIRTRFVGVNSGSNTDPVFILSGCGSHLEFLDIYGCRYLANDTPSGSKAIACIEMEGGNNPTLQGLHTIKNCLFVHAKYGIRLLGGYYDDNMVFHADESHADMTTLEDVSFFECESVIRSENQIGGFGWNIRRMVVEDYGTRNDTIIFDWLKGGTLTVNTLTVNHARPTILRIEDHSSHDCWFDIHGIYTDRPADFPNKLNYITLVKFTGTTDNGETPWRIRMSGGIGDHEFQNWDYSKLILINPDGDLDTSDMMFDLTNLPKDDFTIVGSGPFWTPNKAIIHTKAAFPMEEGTGTTTKEKWGEGPDGTISGATWTTGFKSVRKGLLFTNTTDLVNIPSDIHNRIYVDSTIAFWFKLVSYRDGVILSRVGAQLCGFRTEAGPDAFFVSEGDGNRFGGNLSAHISVGAWQHIAVTVDSGYGAELFIDGVSIATDSFTGGAWLGADLALRLGVPLASFYDSLTDAANVALDDLRIYGRVLADEDIATLANMKNI